MIKFNLNDKKQFSVVVLIKYIVCLMIIEFLILSFNFVVFINQNNKTVNAQMFSVGLNDSIKEDTIGNYRLEFTDDAQDYYIKVNCQTQVVIVYVADENGNYTIPVKKMICSTGDATPATGVFKISDKYEWRYLVGGVYGQYATRITGQILFHSVPYTKKDKSSLEYWEYDKLGQPASKGCVRLTVQDSKWIFDNCKKGTQVEFCYEDTNENKLISKKISDYDDELKGWDPTDPDENNPWREYIEQNKGENK